MERERGREKRERELQAYTDLVLRPGSVHDPPKLGAREADAQILGP